MTYLKTLLFCLSFLILTACATSKESFDCPYGKGVGCRSITEVNTLVNQGKLGTEHSDKMLPSSSPSAVAIHQSSIDSDSMLVERVVEEHLRLWIAPFQDKQGNFHEGAILHTVLKPGFWQVSKGI